MPGLAWPGPDALQRHRDFCLARLGKRAERKGETSAVVYSQEGMAQKQECRGLSMRWALRPGVTGLRGSELAGVEGKSITTLMKACRLQGVKGTLGTFCIHSVLTATTTLPKLTLRSGVSMPPTPWSQPREAEGPLITS